MSETKEAKRFLGETRVVERAFGAGPCAPTEAMALAQDHLANAES